MSAFCISDTHWGHKSILGYDKRRGTLWTTMSDHDEGMIEEWNKVVGPRDEVYHLGDFAFSRKPNEIFSRLNGRKYLIRGNHDHSIVTDLNWEWVKDKFVLKANGARFVMFHYPILSWEDAHHGSFHLHGHCHGNVNYLNYGTPRLDVGVESLLEHFGSPAPVALEDIYAHLKGSKWSAPDHHVSNSRPSSN